MHIKYTHIHHNFLSSEFPVYVYVCSISYVVNCLWWKSFTVEEMNCSSLENIHGYMVVLCIAQGYYH